MLHLHLKTPFGVEGGGNRRKWPKAPTSSYKVSAEDVIYNMMTVGNILWYI